MSIKRAVVGVLAGLLLLGAVPVEAFAADEPTVLDQVLDKRYIEVPWGYVRLPEAGSWQVGPIDLTPTKYIVYLWLTGFLTLLLLFWARRSARRHHKAETTGAPPRGAYNAVEAIILFLREEVALKNIGHGGDRYVPLVISLFFFILVSNLMGLIPFGASVTANISVTATLALFSLVAIEFSGLQSLGFKGWLGTIFYWNKDLPAFMRLPMFLIMSPVEAIGKIIKPVALAIRLMANMVGGKIAIYSLIGLIFIFGSWWVVAGPIILTVGLTFLKIFIAFLQAYIFAMLTSVFIGLIRHAH